MHSKGPCKHVQSIGQASNRWPHVIIPALAIAGSLARKKRLAVTGGTIPTYGPVFAGLLLGSIVLVTALTFFPALSLGPIAEQYLMHLGTTVR
jgi:K+-transporting ATPase ATPase A chain